jgi:hypothetical protein
MLPIQKGMRVTSTSLAGSQNPIGIPGTGVGRGGRGHRHGIWLGFSVSSRPPVLTLMGPIERGNKQDQQISVNGLTNLPGQANVETVVLRVITTTNHVRGLTCMQNHVFTHNNFLNFFIESVPKESSDLFSFDSFFILILLGWLIYRWFLQNQWGQLLEMLRRQLQREHLILSSSHKKKKHVQNHEDIWSLLSEFDFEEEEERKKISLNVSQRPRSNGDFLNA